MMIWLNWLVRGATTSLHSTRYQTTGIATDLVLIKGYGGRRTKQSLGATTSLHSTRYQTTGIATDLVLIKGYGGRRTKQSLLYVCHLDRRKRNRPWLLFHCPPSVSHRLFSTFCHAQRKTKSIEFRSYLQIPAIAK
nr:hypothetical protein CFP56_05139 [Quercus suber]